MREILKYNVMLIRIFMVILMRYRGSRELNEYQHFLMLAGAARYAKVQVAQICDAGKISKKEGLP